MAIGVEDFLGRYVETLNNKADKNTVGVFAGQSGRVYNMNLLPLGISTVTAAKDFTLNAPLNEDADWLVTTTEYNNLRVQSAVKMNNPTLQYVRKESGGIWTAWSLI